MSDTKKAAAADIVILVVIMLTSAYMFAASGPFAAETKLFPRIVSTAVFLCCAAKLALTVRAAGKAEGQSAGRKRLFSRNQAVVQAASLLYVVLLVPIGFLPCTIAVLIALPYMLGYQRWKALIPFAVVITVAFYVIFRYGFYIKLPAGVLSGLL